MSISKLVQRIRDLSGTTAPSQVDVSSLPPLTPLCENTVDQLIDSGDDEWESRLNDGFSNEWNDDQAA